MKETPTHLVISHASKDVSMARVEIGMLQPANCVLSLITQDAITSKYQAYNVRCFQILCHAVSRAEPVRP